MKYFASHVMISILRGFLVNINSRNDMENTESLVSIRLAGSALQPEL